MRRHDVAVVGGGLSGLVAAQHLAGKGYDVRLVEQLDRLGGRIETARSAESITLELGAGRIGSFHTVLRELCEQHAIALCRETYQSAALFDTICGRGGPLNRSRQRILETEIERLITLCLEAASESFIDDRLRHMGVRAWLRERGGAGEAIALFSDLPRGSQSAWALLALIRGASGEAFFTSPENFRAPEGMSALVKGIAEAIGSEVIQLGAAARSMTIDEGGAIEIEIEIRGRIHDTVRAAAVILAVPPAGLASIRGAPCPANMLGRLTRNRQIIAVLSCGPSVAALRSALSDRGFRTAIVRAGDGEHRCLLEIGTLEGHGRPRKPPIEVARAAAEALGLSQHLLAAFERDWARVTGIGGSYGALPPGTVSQEEQEMIGLGTVCIAGDMAISKYAGYMEGAVRSGQAAARYVEGQLGGGHSNL